MRLDLMVRRRRAISMVPLIDVVFILLLFFMLSTDLVQGWEVPVDFPTPDSKPSDQQIRIIRLESEDGSFTHEGVLYGSSDPQALSGLIAQDPKAPYAIDTAPGVSTQALIRLLDRLNLAGAKNLSLMEAPQ